LPSPLACPGELRSTRRTFLQPTAQAQALCTATTFRFLGPATFQANHPNLLFAARQHLLEASYLAVRTPEEVASRSQRLFPRPAALQHFVEDLSGAPPETLGLPRPVVEGALFDVS